MRSIPTPLAGALLLEPKLHGDERGWFYESWNEQQLAALGVTARFVQDNHARSRRGVLRGMHWQVIQPQGKLVRCTFGAVFDAIVDLRRSSPTHGQWFGAQLDAVHHRQMWVPPGFAHGYLVLSEMAEVLYKTTDYWCKAGERGLRWNDPAIGIQWPDAGPVEVNARDAGFPLIADLPSAEQFP